MIKYAFGVDVGGTSVKLGLFDTNAALLDNWEIITRTENNGDYILEDVAKAVNQKIEEKGINKEDVLGVGIGVPGPVKGDGTVIQCVNLGWGCFNVAEKLQDLINMPVKVANDANIAALGEMWQGGGKGYKNVVMVTLGTGVGGGIIVDGEVVPGSNGAGGEIGHMTVNLKEEVSCNCGKKGCLEQYASATGIVNTAIKVLNQESTESSLRHIDELTAKDIFDAAKAGDQLAMDLVEGLGENLGLVCSHVACVVNPEVFVIGGGVSKAGEIIPTTIKKYYLEYAFHALKNCEFVLAQLGNDAGIYGGAKLILG